MVVGGGKEEEDGDDDDDDDDDDIESVRFILLCNYEIVYNTVWYKIYNKFHIKHQNTKDRYVDWNTPN